MNTTSKRIVPGVYSCSTALGPATIERAGKVWQVVVPHRMRRLTAFPGQAGSSRLPGSFRTRAEAEDELRHAVERALARAS